MAQAAVRMDESELIRAAQQGDQRAFEQLVRLYDQNVLRLALNLLRSPEDANDIYQEAFLRVYKNLHTFRFDCSFHTWLYRIVTNLCLDRAAKAESAARGKRRWWRPARGLWTAWTRVEEDARRWRSAAPAHEPVSCGSAFKRCWADLTPRERTVFEMRHYQGLRLRTIGEVMGTSEEAAKNCLFRATQKMRTALGDFV